MKQLYYILTLSMLSTALFGQSMHILRYTDHAFQKGDTLIKQQVEYKVPGNKGSGQFWDFQTLKPINEAYKLTYSRISDVDTSQMCGLEHHTRYYYRQQNSTLQATGFENATTYMRYVQPELRIRYPMAYGDTLYSTFAGIGQYCHRIPLRVNGYTQVQVDGEGDLLLPEMPVIKKSCGYIHTAGTPKQGRTEWR